MDRPTHYVAHGTTLAFQCYHDAYLAFAGSAYTIPAVSQPGRYSAPRTEHRLPWPSRTTDLSKVTCPSCWKEIRAMAVRRC